MFSPESANQTAIGTVREVIRARLRRITSIQVAVGKMKFSRLDVIQQLMIFGDHLVHALEIKILRRGRRVFIGEALQGAKLGNELQQKCENSRENAGFAVFRSEIAFVVGAGEMIKKFPARLISFFSGQILFARG